MSLENEVFISYAWGSQESDREQIVNELDQALQVRQIKLVRDKRDLGYKGVISDFMERIGRGNSVIVVISDKYLRSKNCMMELIEIARNQSFYERIFPIVLQDADIYNVINRIKYIKYWEDKITELDEAMKTVSSANLHGIREELDLYDEIRDNIARLTDILQDMNTLTPEMHENTHFDQLIDALEERIRQTPPDEPQPAPPPPPVPVTSPQQVSPPQPETAPPQADTYVPAVLKKLKRDQYELLDEQRYGQLRFQHAARKINKWLMGFTGESHTFLFLEQAIPDEDTYLDLVQEIHEYKLALSKEDAYLQYVICVVTTDDIDEAIIEPIVEAKRYHKKATTLEKESLLIVYSRRRNDIFFPKNLPNDAGPSFREKIENYLVP